MATDARRFQTVDDTDSEQAFCQLLEQLAVIWRQEQPPDLDQKRAVLQQFGDRMRSFGPANFLYSDSEALFAYGDKRRQRPDGT